MDTPLHNSLGFFWASLVYFLVHLCNVKQSKNNPAIDPMPVKPDMLDFLYWTCAREIFVAALVVCASIRFNSTERCLNILSIEDQIQYLYMIK